MIQGIFASILHMSIMASIAVILIMIFKLIIGKRLPKVFCYALWFFVLLRLIIPFSLSSAMSIFNVISIPKPEVIQNLQYTKINSDTYQSKNNTDITQEKTTSQNTNEANIDSSQTTVSPVTYKTPESRTDILPWIWLTGLAGMLLFSIYAYLHTWRDLRTSVLYKCSNLINECRDRLKLKRNIKVYTTDVLCTPVVYGMIKPNIILPLGIAEKSKEPELRYIISHELVHIKRFDNIIKPLWILVLCLHWFNPLIWMAFILFQKDMEMSCDEKVMCLYDCDIRSEYAASLINVAVEQSLILNSSMLAFGESNIKRRVKGIMKFKKPSLGMVIASFVILAAVGALILTNGQYKAANKKLPANVVSSKTEGNPAASSQTGNVVTEMTNYNVISPSVSKEMKEKLLGYIEGMKKINPITGGTILFYNEKRIIVYCDPYIVAIDLTENNKGIYSIIKANDYIVGNCQSSNLASIYPSPDGLACIMGTNFMEAGTKITDSLYVCNLIDGSVKAIKPNYNMKNNKVTWYRNTTSSTMLPWYALIEGPDSKIIWSIEKSKKLSSLPLAAKEEDINITSIDFSIDNAEYNYLDSVKKDDSTAIGARYYVKGATSSTDINLSDLQIVEINLNNKEIKVLYKIN